MKRVVLILIFIAISLLTVKAQKQFYKLKATSVSSRYIDIETLKMKDWKELEPSKALIAIDERIDRITIYDSNTAWVFDIVKYEGKSTDNEGDDVVSYSCLSDIGLDVKVKWLTLKSQSGTMQVYILLQDLNYVYNVYMRD